jgi:hypothetical protein
LLRQRFVRDRISDASLEIFESQINKFLATLPTDGTTIDLEDVLYEYALHVNVEYLVGVDASSFIFESVSPHIISPVNRRLRYRNILLGCKKR